MAGLCIKQQVQILFHIANARAKSILKPMSATRVPLVKHGTKLKVNACGLAMQAKSAKTAGACAISVSTLTTVLAKIAV